MQRWPSLGHANAHDGLRRRALATPAWNRCEPATVALRGDENGNARTSITIRDPGVFGAEHRFEPATFALATRHPGIHESPLPSTNHHDPAISLGSPLGTWQGGSTNLHADSLVSCAPRVPARAAKRGMRCRLLDVNQVAELLGCSTAPVYDLCGRRDLAGAAP